jgi:succinylglutamate desuccinylase
MTELQGWLDRFDALRTPGPYAYPRHHHHDGGKHDLHVVIGAIIHGDEVGSLPAVVGLLDRLLHHDASFGGKLTVFLGNPEASLLGRRFVESDLNRVFVDDPPDDHEGRRARELRPMLDDADVFLDLHQTILETDRPFYIFPWSIPGWQWARAIAGARTWVTRPPTQAFSPGTCCADEYVRLRGRPGLTLELGQRGFSDDAAARAAGAIDRLIRVADRVGLGADTLAGAATHEPDLDFVETRWRGAFTDPMLRLKPGLTNFAPVRAGERLSADGSPELAAPADGLLLFPKYPDYAPDGRVVEPRPGEIVRVVAPLPEHPAVAWESGG